MLYLYPADTNTYKLQQPFDSEFSKQLKCEILRFIIIFSIHNPVHVIRKVKQFITILFCAGLVVQNSGIFLVLASYSANKDYIAKNLCENKNKPSMHCNGKCFLAKKLREEQKQESTVPANYKVSPVLQLFFPQRGLEFACHFNDIHKPIYQRYNELQTVRKSNYIFHPPNA